MTAELGRFCAAERLSAAATRQAKEAAVYSQTNPALAMSFHAMIASGTPQPILDGIRTGYDGPVVVARDFTIIDVTLEQIVMRMAASDPAPALASDPAYLKAKGGANQDASVMHGLSERLEDTILQVPRSKNSSNG